MVFTSKLPPLSVKKRRNSTSRFCFASSSSSDAIYLSLSILYYAHAADLIQIDLREPRAQQHSLRRSVRRQLVELVQQVRLQRSSLPHVEKLERNLLQRELCGRIQSTSHHMPIATLQHAESPSYGSSSPLVLVALPLEICHPCRATAPSRNRSARHPSHSARRVSTRPDPRCVVQSTTNRSPEPTTNRSLSENTHT